MRDRTRRSARRSGLLGPCQLVRAVRGSGWVGRTVYEVAVEFDVIVRAAPALHGRVRLCAARQACERT